MNRLVLKVACLLSVASACAQTDLALSVATVSNEPPANVSQTNDLAETDALRAYLEVQAQLRATQLALERNQREAEAAAARNAQELTERLQQIEKSIADRRERDLQAMQSNNHVILIVAGLFAGVGFLAMLFTAYFHWRGVARLSEMSLSVAPGSAARWAMHSIDDAHAGLPMESAGRLLGAIDRLEKRILQIEHTTRTPVQDASSANVIATSSTLAASPEEAARITLLLGKGQSLLNLDKSEEAVACFDEVLALDPNNTDALVKKGVALERLRKLNEAIECYDKAIAADSSVTIAYLYKGGVFNRLERFDEALQCYEQALRLRENGSR